MNCGELKFDIGTYEWRGVRFNSYAVLCIGIAGLSFILWSLTNNPVASLTLKLTDQHLVCAADISEVWIGKIMPLK